MADDFCGHWFEIGLATLGRATGLKKQLSSKSIGGLVHIVRGPDAKRRWVFLSVAALARGMRLPFCNTAKNSQHGDKTRPEKRRLA
jgi:hypothetical protein